jgi:hypothetical protein
MLLTTVAVKIGPSGLQRVNDALRASGDVRRTIAVAVNYNKNKKLLEHRQLLRPDANAPFRQLGHDFGALVVAETGPTGDFRQRPLATDAQAALAIDQTDFHARRGDDAGLVHRPQMAQAAAERKPSVLSVWLTAQ